MPPTIPAPEWLDQIMTTMIEEGLTLQQSCDVWGQPIDSAQLKGLPRTKSYKDMWEAKTRRFHEHLGSTTVNTKEVIVGRMEQSAAALRAMGKHKEAADTELNIAKVLGLTGSETTINLFDKLSGEGRARVKKIIADKAAAPQPEAPTDGKSTVQ